MYFISNEINPSGILDKFDGFYNNTNIIKTRIINEMKWIFVFKQFKQEVKENVGC